MSSIVELKWRGSLMLRISMSWWSSLDYDTRPLIKQISTSFHDQSRIITSIFYSSCVLFAIKNMNEWVHGKKFFGLLEVGEFWTTTIFFEITQKKMCSCSVSQASLQHFKCHFFSSADIVTFVVVLPLHSCLFIFLHVGFLCFSYTDDEEW